MDEPIRRITPLTVLADIGSVVEQYRGLGCQIIDTGEPGCVGVRVGLTYLILATAEHMRGDFAAETVAPLIGHTVSYLYVRSVGEAVKTLSGEACIVEQVATRGGIIEAVVRHNGRYLILAERFATPEQTH